MAGDRDHRRGRRLSREEREARLAAVHRRWDREDAAIQADIDQTLGAMSPEDLQARAAAVFAREARHDQRTR